MSVFGIGDDEATEFKRFDYYSLNPDECLAGISIFINIINMFIHILVPSINAFTKHKSRTMLIMD